MKQRGSPDQRGMGAPSDRIAETFVPSQSHTLKRLAMARHLLATGMTLEQVAAMLSIPADQIESPD